MSSRRTLILMGTLLLVLAGYVSLQRIPRKTASFTGVSPPRAPLAGNNSVSGLAVKHTVSGGWTAEFNYFYTGTPPHASLFTELTLAADPKPVVSDTYLGIPQRGSHHLSVDLRYPGTSLKDGTVRVAILMRTNPTGGVAVASQQVDDTVDWPNVQAWTPEQTPTEHLKEAQALIDTGEETQIGEAKPMLEELLEQNPKFDPAYVELARLVLYAPGGPEGRHQAEALLDTALQVQPDNTDAKILLADVYAHQRRFTKAEALFKEAAATPTSNLWLWENWGDMLEAEGQFGRAAAMYRKVIAHPMTHDRNDRPRPVAYHQLLELLSKNKDFDGVEAVYKQQIAEYGLCASADYTRFLLQIRGNVDGSIDSARRAMSSNCNDSSTGELLGLAEYAKWADSKGPARTEALNQARIFLPMSAKALYLLAASEPTATAARQLVAAGEPIDQKDNLNLDALAYALQNRDFGAARRLVKLGAHPETPVGMAAIPVALLPVLSGDVEGVHVMTHLGVHYSKLKYRGATAIDFARQQGNEAMISALGGASTAL